MKLQTKNFREACRTILMAIDNKESSLYTETLELKTSGQTLEMSVTNREYFVTVKFDLGYEESFHASVKADKFLKLIDKITTEEIEITQVDNNIKIKANGEYKLPIIYNNDVMLELPVIEVGDVTNQLDITTDILNSIVVHNSKELQRGKPSKEVSKYYYVDKEGCITFVSGACVNSFTLTADVKMLLSEKVVKLLKLFNTGSTKVTLGKEKVSDELTQTKVRFENDKVMLTAKMPQDSLFNDIPVTAIRGLATKEFPYRVSLNKSTLSEIMNRLTIFTDERNYGYLDFNNTSVTVSDFSKNNKETLMFKEPCESLESYSIIMNLDNLKKVLDGCTDEYIDISFGDNRSVLIKKNNISDLLPELRVM